VSTQNKITLTIAGDSTSVERALKRTEAAAAHAGTAVSKSSRDLANGLHETRQSAAGAASAVDGAMYSMRAFGLEIPGVTQNVYAAALGASQLAHGAGELIPKLTTMAAEMSTLKFAAFATAGVLGGVVIAAELGTAAGNKLNDMLGRTPSLAESSANAIRKATGEVAAYAAALGYANANALQMTKALTTLQYHNQNGTLNDSTGYMQGPVPLDATGRLLNSTNGGDTYAKAQSDAKKMEAAIAAARSAAMRASSAGAAAASKASSAAAQAMEAAIQAAKDKLARWQGIADRFSGIAKGIADSLGPKLVAGVSSPLMLAKGTSLLDNLRKQLDDTKHLQGDLAKLSKMGLSRGLLEQLTAGGLGSLGAADELLGSGKSGVHAVNKVAGQINSAAGSIAGQDAARQLADSLKKPQVVELRVGKGGDDVLDRWLSKALKTKGPKYYGLKAA
jgi:hypothetical protein